MIKNLRTAVFIDGSNLNTSLKSLGETIDFNALHKYFDKQTELVRIYYYATIREDTKETLSKLLDWLEYNGFTTLIKEVYETSYSRKIKGSINVELVTDMLSLVHSAELEQVVLFSGDGDYAYAIRKVKEMGIRTVTFSTLEALSDSLHRVSDEICYLGQCHVLFELQEAYL